MSDLSQLETAALANIKAKAKTKKTTEQDYLDALKLCPTIACSRAVLILAQDNKNINIHKVRKEIEKKIWDLKIQGEDEAKKKLKPCELIKCKEE